MSANIEGLLPAYAWGELDEQQASRVEEAIASSEELRRELERYERLSVLLAAAAAQEIEPPGGLEKRIQRQLALKAYVEAAERVVAGVLGAYGRALIDYLRLA